VIEALNSLMTKLRATEKRQREAHEATVGQIAALEAQMRESLKQIELPTATQKK